MEVGFLGLGIMGKAMATNLLRHGYRVTVWNRTLAKVPPGGKRRRSLLRLCRRRSIRIRPLPPGLRPLVPLIDLWLTYSSPSAKSSSRSGPPSGRRPPPSSPSADTPSPCSPTPAPPYP